MAHATNLRATDVRIGILKEPHDPEVWAVKRGKRWLIQYRHWDGENADEAVGDKFDFWAVNETLSGLKSEIVEEFADHLVYD